MRSGAAGISCTLRAARHCLQSEAGPDTAVVIDMSEISSGRSWSLYGVSGGEGSFSDRKSLLGCETWRLAPHRGVTHCSASSNSAIKTRMVQGHEVITDFLHGMYSKTCLKRTPYIPETWTNGK